MKQKLHFAAGILTGIALMACTGFTEGNQTAVPTWQPLFLDGEQVQMKAYNVNGHNYVKLRDIGEQMGFNVYWLDGVQIRTEEAYTGEPPEKKEETDIGQPPVEVEIIPDSQQKPAENRLDFVQEQERNLEEIRLDIVQKINDLRAEKGVEPLKISTELMGAAQDIAENHNSEHDNQLECQTVLLHGYEYGFGSNLTTLGNASGTDIAMRAVNSWRYSPGHYETMMDPTCDSIGVGVAVTREQVYCCMFAGCPSSDNPYA